MDLDLFVKLKLGLEMMAKFICYLLLIVVVFVGRRHVFLINNLDKIFRSSPATES